MTAPVLVLLPDRNSPPKKDYTGAFKPCAATLVRELGARVVAVPVPTVDQNLGVSGKQAAFERAASVVIDTLIRAPRLSHLVFLCHGWSGGVQLGLRSAKQKGADAANLGRFIDALAPHPLKSITLFACSAGDEPGSEKTAPGTGDGSFADTLRDRTGIPVLAHYSVGHCVYNADLIYFDATPGVGGTALLRGTPDWRLARSRLRSGAWKRLPLCTSYAEMHALLSAR